MWDGMLKSKTRSMRDLSTDDILGALGLQRARTPFDAALPTTIAFIAGAATGAGIALLLAPKTGREMRQDLSDKTTELTNKVSELTKRLSSKATEVAEETRAALPMTPMTQSLSENRPITGSNRSTS